MAHRIPQIPQTITKRWWLWHKECTREFAWFAGPFNSKPEAEKFRDEKLLNGPHCPGCGEPTPTKNDYDIGQM